MEDNDSGEVSLGVSYSYAYEELCPNLEFSSFEDASHYIKNWCDTNNQPLVKRDSCKGTDTRAGKLIFQCPHAIKRKYTAKIRVCQAVNYTGCESKVSIYENRADGVFRVTQCIKTHSGHLLGENIYGSYPTVRVLSDDMKKKILQMESVGASRRRIADSVGEETGIMKNLTY